MAATMGDSQLQRIIKDLQDAVTELNREFKEMGDPITDDSTNLHKFFYKLEYLLQFDLKEKSTLLGNKKDYWDYFCDCLAKIKGANDGIRFVKSASELKTSLGKGRAFLRYSLVHQRLADTLQQCFMNDRVTRDWYYARSPFLKVKTSLEIVGYLYELTEVQFDLVSRGYDLDATWPTFARRTLGSSVSSSYLWRPPSRSSSIGSLLSANFQNQGFPGNLEPNNSLNAEPLDSLDEMRIELDQSEVRMKELESLVKQLEKENQYLHNSLQLQLEQSKAEREKNNSIADGNVHLTKMLEELQKQREFSQTTQNKIQELQNCLYTLQLNEPERENLEVYPKNIWEPLVQELEKQRTLLSSNEILVNELQTKLNLSEQHNKEISRKMVSFKHESDHEAPAIDEFQHKMQSNSILYPLSTVTENPVESEEKRELKEKEYAKQLLSVETKDGLLKKDNESLGLEIKPDVQSQHIASLEKCPGEALEDDKKLGDEYIFKDETQKQNHEAITEQLHLLEDQLSDMSKNLCACEKKRDQLINGNHHLTRALESLEEQIAKNYLDMTQVTEKNNKLLFENKELNKANATLKHENGELAKHIHSLETQVEMLYESEKLLRSQIETALVTLEEKEKKLWELNKQFDENMQTSKSQCKNMDEKYNILEEDFREMQDRENQAKSNLSLLQSKHNDAVMLISQLEESIRSLKESKESVNAELAENSNILPKEGEEKAVEKLALTQALLAENQNLVQHLKEKAEQLNVDHMEEILKFNEREGRLIEEKEKSALENIDLKEQISSINKELVQVTQQAEKNRSDHSEMKEMLNRANADTAKLHTQILSLTKEKEDLHAELASLKSSKEALEEKVEDHEMCGGNITVFQEKLLETEKKLKSVHESSEEEISTMKFHYSTEILDYQKQIKTVSEELESLKQQHEIEKQIHLELQQEMQNLQSKKLTDDLRAQNESESILAKYEGAVTTLTESLERKENELETANKEISEYLEKLMSIKMEKNSNDQKMLATIDDLNRTKQYLEERLIELIRDKDALWQKSDALEYEQKIRAAERWMGDTEVNQCLDCKKHFNWMVRRHHCRLCGRIFCYYCCNNYVMTKHSGKKERCCQTCFRNDQISNTCDSDGNEDSTLSEASSSTGIRGVTVTEDSKSLKDTVYDIITDEELNQVLDSTSSPAEDEDSLDQCTAELNSSSNSLATDDSEDLQIAQDNEIHLLTTGELMLKLPLTVEEIMNFGESSRELFIKSGTYSIIPITVTEPALTISWVFSSDTKSITFSVVYQETESAPLDQCKVLIPMIRCNSHKEPIQGELKVRNPGIYSLIFDNTFSRFISKRVFYRLAVEQPVVYDGSDSP
ncbi:FYVE and coiled-coil domain-containing protein 1 [Pelodytes ibericus]